MERYQDISELLETVESSIELISKSYNEAKQDEEQKVVSRPLVKSSLEHLRSVLEYSAQDIWATYNNKNKKLYFPYGKTDALFHANVKRNLPKLIDNNPKILQLIKSLQPFDCGDDWLSELCDQTNFNKHNKLGKQVRKNSSKATTNVDRLVSLGGSGTVTFSNCSYNGVPLGHGKPAVISNDMSVKQIKSNIGGSIPVSREFDWVEFRFENSPTDTLELIKKSHSKISSYIEQLRIELS